MSFLMNQRFIWINLNEFHKWISMIKGAWKKVWGMLLENDDKWFHVTHHYVYKCELTVDMCTWLFQAKIITGSCETVRCTHNDCNTMHSMQIQTPIHLKTHILETTSIKMMHHGNYFYSTMAAIGIMVPSMTELERRMRCFLTL